MHNIGDLIKKLLDTKGTWNDSPTTTFAKVKELVESLDI